MHADALRKVLACLYKDNQQVDGAFWAVHDGDAEKADIKASYALSVGYTSPAVLFGPISVKAGFGAAYFQTTSDYDGVVDPTTAYWKNAYDNYTQFAASISWGTLGQGIYTAAAFQMRNFEMLHNNAGMYGYGTGPAFSEYDVMGGEFVISYGFDNGVTLIAGYNLMLHTIKATKCLSESFSSIFLYKKSE